MATAVKTAMPVMPRIPGIQRHVLKRVPDNNAVEAVATTQ
jgi:hypothetical protein